jgi:protein-tyrosine phosphatase
MQTTSDGIRPAVRLVRRTARQLRDAARNALDRPLHASRRRRAHTRLEQAAPASVLFVCSGNICRSPYAERRWSALRPDVAVDSAGFIGPDRGPPPEALSAAAERGIVHADHRSKVLQQDMARRADAIFAFDGRLVARIRREYPNDGGKIYWLGDFDPV